MLALLLTASSGLVLLIGFGVHWFSGLEFESAVRSLWSWVAPALFAAISLPAGAWVVIRERRREQPWMALVPD